MAAAFNTRERWDFAAKVFFSVLFGIPALYVASKGQPPESVKWATGLIGFILGYWLK